MLKQLTDFVDVDSRRGKTPKQHSYRKHPDCGDEDRWGAGVNQSLLINMTNRVECRS